MKILLGVHGRPAGSVRNGETIVSKLAYFNIDFTYLSRPIQPAYVIGERIHLLRNSRTSQYDVIYPESFFGKDAADEFVRSWKIPGDIQK